MNREHTVIIAITCQLTPELRQELDDLGVKLMERSDPLLLRLLIRHLRSALQRPGCFVPPGKRPVKHPMPLDVPKPRYWRHGQEKDG